MYPDDLILWKKISCRTRDAAARDEAEAAKVDARQAAQHAAHLERQMDELDSEVTSAKASARRAHSALDDMQRSNNELVAALKGLQSAVAHSRREDGVVSAPARHSSPTYRPSRHDVHRTRFQPSHILLRESRR